MIQPTREQVEAAERIVNEYAQEYEYDDEGSFYTPTEQEGTLLVDFGHGLIARLQEAGLLAAGAATRPAAVPGPDVLTEEEVNALIFAQSNMSTPGWRASLHEAARIGAEREREQCATWLEGKPVAKPGDETAIGYAAAIRRGEGE